MSHWQFRCCPICQSDDSYPVVVAPLNAENMNFEEVKRYWTGFVKKPCFFTYYRCKNCELLYNKYYFSETQLHNLYSDMNDNTDGVNSFILNKTNLGYLKFFSRIISKIKINSYLELGPDIGLFAKPFINLFNPSEISYIEPNTSVHDTLKNNSSKAVRVSIFNDLSELVANSDVKPFEAVAGIHVFDHLINPVLYLDKLLRLVDSGSLIYSVTHNEKSLLRKIMRKHWIPFCLQHPQLYNPETLEILFNKLGFDLVSCKPTTNWFPISHLSSVILRLFTSKATVKGNFLNYSIPIRLGNIQAAFRRK
jgi:hypothetical protein